MVSKIFKLLHKEIAGIHQAAYILGLFTISSQLLGLFRDRLLAHLFGAGVELDIYYAAFRLPDLLFLTVASFVSISVLIPFFIDRFEKSKEGAKEFLDSIFSIFFLAIVVLSAVVYVVIPFLVPLLFPGFDAGMHTEIVRLSRILLFSPFLLGLSNLFATVTQAHQRFLLHAMSPLLYNLGIILGIVLLVPSFGITGVVYGVVGGAFFHLMIQVPFIISKGFFPRFTFSWPSETIRYIILHSAPRRIALSIHHIAIIFLFSVASLMSEGSITIFQFSFNLQSVLVSVIGASYSVAAFPVLTRLFSRGDTKKFKERILTTARHIIFWSLPFTALFIVLRAQIVRTILGSGQFDWNDTRLTAAALALFTISLMFQGLMLLFVRGYFAIGNTKTPFFINVFSGFVMVASSFGLWYIYETSSVFRQALEQVLRVDQIDGTAVLMLPLGYTIGFVVNGILLCYFFERDLSIRLRSLIPSFVQSLLGATFAGIISYFALAIFDDVFDMSTLVGIFLQGLCAGLIGISSMLAVLIAVKNKELFELWRALHKKFGRTQVVPQETQTLE